MSVSNSSFEYNYSEFEEPCSVEGNPVLQRFLQVYVHSIICIVGFIGNTLVILTYALYKRTKSMTDVYLLNVAIADILFVVALPLIIFSEQNSWTLGTWSCKLLSGIYSINLYSGILLLACISLDRYLAIVQARRSFRLRSRTLVYSYLICGVVWVMALALSLPTFIFYESYKTNESYKPNENQTTDYSYDGTDPTPALFTATEDPGMSLSYMTSSLQDEERNVCFFRFEENDTAKRMKVMVPSSQVAVGFCLPLIVMGFCYSQVVATLLHAKNFQRHKAVRVVLTVVIVFIACHLPYNIALLYDTITMFDLKDCREEEIKNQALLITQSLEYLHCCLNPLLYAFVGVNFRNHFRKIVEDIWCLGKRYMARRSSRANSDTYFSSKRSAEGSGYETATSFTM